MSMPPPKRYESEPTVVIDLSRVLSPEARREFARAAERMLIDGRAFRDDEAITMMACPACAACPGCKGRHLVQADTLGRYYDDCGECAFCTYCNGGHMVTPERCAAFGREK